MVCGLGYKEMLPVPVLRHNLPSVQVRCRPLKTAMVRNAPKELSFVSTSEEQQNIESSLVLKQHKLPARKDWNLKHDIAIDWNSMEQ